MLRRPSSGLGSATADLGAVLLRLPLTFRWSTFDAVQSDSRLPPHLVVGPLQAGAGTRQRSSILFNRIFKERTVPTVWGAIQRIGRTRKVFSVRSVGCSGCRLRFRPSLSSVPSGPGPAFLCGEGGFYGSTFGGQGFSLGGAHLFCKTANAKRFLARVGSKIADPERRGGPASPPWGHFEDFWGAPLCRHSPRLVGRRLAGHGRAGAWDGWMA